MEHARGGRPGAPAGGGAQLLLVGGLLVIIIGALAALWMMERRRRGRVEQQLRRMDQRAAQDRLREFLRTPGVAGRARGVDRGKLPRETRIIDGRKREVFRVSAGEARWADFRPGDIIVVGEPRPATAPAETPRTGRPAGEEQGRTESK